MHGSKPNSLVHSLQITSSMITEADTVKFLTSSSNFFLMKQAMSSLLRSTFLSPKQWKVSICLYLSLRKPLRWEWCFFTLISLLSRLRSNAMSTCKLLSLESFLRSSSLPQSIRLGSSMSSLWLWIVVSSSSRVLLLRGGKCTCGYYQVFLPHTDHDSGQVGCQPQTLQVSAILSLLSLQIQHCHLQQQTPRNGQFDHPQGDPDHSEGRLPRETLPYPQKLARWVVLTNNLVLTYKERRVYESPTEIILLKDVVSIKTAEDELEQKNSFKIQTNTTSFYFCTDTGAEKESWIGALGRALVKRNNKDLE